MAKSKGEIEISNQIVTVVSTHKTEQLSLRNQFNRSEKIWTLHTNNRTVSGPIQKKTSMSDDSTSDMMELEETALAADAQLDSSLRRLREEERRLLGQQARLDVGACLEDVAALDHQDALRLNQLQQQELQRQQALAARLALRQGAAAAAAAGARERRDPRDLREPNAPRRRATCTVRVNNLHAAEAIETDV